MSTRASSSLLLATLLGFGCGEERPGTGPGLAGIGSDPIGQARVALAEASPRRALALVGKETAGPGLVLRLRAMVGVDEWGSVESLLAKVPAGPDKDGVACLLAAVRLDVSCVRKCELAASRTYDDPVLGDEVHIALAKAYETEHRPEPAEKTLRGLAAARPTRPNLKALVDFFDRQGFVKDAVQALEDWYKTSPDDPTLKARLGQMLERKVRGDLLDKRWAEAEAAASRLLTLVPTRQEIRYYRADALEKLGRTVEATDERKRAQDSGVKPPPPVDSFPGMNPDDGPPPDRGGGRGGGRAGGRHDGHDHHDHEHGGERPLDKTQP